MSHIGDDAHATATDVTSGYAVLSVMGPKAREIMRALSRADFSNHAFPFGASREIEIGAALIRATRITYVGELGWELYIPTEFAVYVFDRLMAAGEPIGLTLAGLHAMDSCRIEKAYRHWGHDISDEDTPIEAGLMFAVKLDKNADFIGREALLRLRQKPLTKRLAQFVLEDPQPLLYHNEPIWFGDKIVGRTTSGAYGHTLGGGGRARIRPGAGGRHSGIRRRREIRDRGRRPALRRAREPRADVRSEARAHPGLTAWRAATRLDRPSGRPDGVRTRRLRKGAAHPVIHPRRRDDRRRERRAERSHP